MRVTYVRNLKNGVDVDIGFRGKNSLTYIEETYNRCTIPLMCASNKNTPESKRKLKLHEQVETARRERVDTKKSWT